MFDRHKGIFYCVIAVMITLAMGVADQAFAQGGTLVSGGYTGCGEDSLFSPPCTDKSIEYLSRIFGKVGGVLTGAEGTVLQEMFSIFNAAVLGLGAIIIMYTLFVGTLKTAHEGEMLGQKWSSVWLPLRSAFGVVLIVPANAAGGYSFVQVFFMWVIVQGVGAADTLWAKILDSLADQRPVIAQPMMQGSNFVFRDAFRGLVCMYALNKIEDPGQPPSYAPVTSGNSIFFRAGKYGDTCGSVTVATGGSVTGNTPMSALEESISILQEAAMSVVYEEPENWPRGALGRASQGYTQELLSKVAKYKREDGGAQQMNEAMRRARDLGWIFAGSYYYDIARIQDRISLQVFNFPSSSVNFATKFSDPSQFEPPNPRDKYDEWTNIFTNKMTKYMRENPIPGGVTAAAYNRDSSAGAFSDPQGQGSTDLGDQVFGRDSATGISTNDSTSFGVDSSDGTAFNTPGGGLQFNAANSGKLTEVPEDSPVRTITDFLYSSLNQLLGFFQQHMSGEDPDTGQQINPMFAMQTFGTYMLFIVELIWLSITVILGALVLIAGAVGAVSATPLGYFFAGEKLLTPLLLAVLTFVTWVISWLGPLLMIMFVLGGVLAHYVPIIPFLLFTFGAIGWLMLVFEAIVAAPIVAMGILHPDEHDVFGKSQPAIMLLTNVFLTPSLMLFGLIGAMMLSYVVVSMVNFGFYNTMVAFTGINEESAGGQIVVAITSITTFIAFIFVYVATIMFSVQKCFSLIPTLRTKVLTWIGGQATGFGEEEGLSQVKGQVEKGQQAAGEKKVGSITSQADKTGGEFSKARQGKESSIPFMKGKGNV